eukprot:Rmarinus@m.7404
MKSRLEEVKKGRGSTAAPQDVDIELGNVGGSSSSQPNFMSDFFEQVAHVKTNMTTIKTNLQMIETKHSAVMTDVYGEKAHKSELEKLMSETNNYARQTKQLLQRMEADNKEFKKKTNIANHPSEVRIRENMHGTLTRKFMELMREYQEAQTKYKSQCEETVRRQFKIVKKDASEEEIERVIQSGEHNVFQQCLDVNAQAAASAVEDIREKHKDILRLEESIKELHQLFMDMALLVESQGELLDQIEHSVSQSVNYVEKATSELEKAGEYQKKSRKKQCCILGFVLVVVLIIVIVWGGVL